MATENRRDQEGHRVKKNHRVVKYYDTIMDNPSAVLCGPIRI